MKNLSDFKKQAKLGVKLHSIYHKEFSHREQGRVIYKDVVKEPREVSIVQSNAIALKTKKADGTFQDSWFAFPKAKECEFIDGKMIVHEDEQRDDKVLTYWFE